MSLQPLLPVRVLRLPRLGQALAFLLPLLLAAELGCGGDTSAPPPPSPVIQGFVAADSAITAGEDVLLTAVFANGSGKVDQGVGAVQSGVPVSVGPLAQDTTFTLTVKGQDSTVTKTASVRVVPAPTQPVITVPALLTAGATGTASVPPQAGCTFTWTISGGTIQGSSSSETLTFTAGSGGYLQLSCIATNSLGKDSRMGQSISTLVAAPQAPVISAPSQVGAGLAGYTASVPLKDGSTYQWAITGGTLTAGERSSLVTFTAGPSGSVQLSCIVTNAAGVASLPGSAACAIVQAPLQPVITVPALLTAGATGTASVPSQVGCTFTWAISGGTIQGSSSSETLTFTAGTGGYLQLNCLATNSLRQDSRVGQSIITLVAAPLAPVVTAPSHVGAGLTGYTASVPAKDGLTYQWTLTGGTLTAGEQGSVVTFTAGTSGSVQLSCVTTNAAGTASLPGTAACTIVTAPPTPSIAVSGAPFKAGDTGSASVDAQPGVVYQWTISGGSFTGASTGSTVSFTAAPKPTLHLTCTARNLFNVASGTATSDSAVTFAKDDVLKALNFDINLGPRRGAKGQNLTDSDHPLGTGQSTHNLFRVKEAFSLNDQNNGGVYQYSPITNPPVRNLLTAEQWARRDAACAAAWNELMTLQVKHSVTARLSPDDREQVVIAAFPGPEKTNDHFTLFKLNKASNTELSKGAQVNLAVPLGTGGSTIHAGPIWDYNPGEFWKSFQPDRQRDWCQKISMAAGDVDGDGLDEILVLAEGHLFIIDHDLQTLLHTEDFVSGWNQDPNPIYRMDVCDIDHDGIAEIIWVKGGTTTWYQAGATFSYKAEFTIRKWHAQGRYLKYLSNVVVWGDNLYWRSAAVKAADLDGDGKVELVFSGLLSGMDKVRTLVMGVDTKPGETETDILWQVYPIASSPNDDLDSQRWSGWGGGGFQRAQMMDAAVPNLGVGDLDGDGNLEIAAFDSVLAYTPPTPTTPAGLRHAWGAPSNNVLRGGIYGDTSCYGQMAVGKFTGDANGHAEILIQDFGKLRRYRFDAGQQKIVREADLPIDNGNQYFYFLSLADLDEDGTYVKYLGHTLTFTNPIINAVLASPPYWEGLAEPQNMGNASTTIGNSSGSTQGGGFSVGFSNGLIAGVKATVPVVGNGEAEIRVTAKNTWDFAFEGETGYQRDVAYSVYAGSNAVLFSCLPVDIYAYEVIAAGPNAKDVNGNAITAGSVINIQKTREPLLQFTDVDYYNAHCGNGPVIDQTILPQTIGRPHSYPTKGMAKSLVDATQGFLLDNAQSGIVPQGNLYNTITYATSLSRGFSVATEIEIEAEGTVSFVALLGQSQSLKIGLNYKTTTTLGESIQGSVGGLPAAMYVPDRLYKWGIYSHVGTLPDPSVKSGSQSFKVVNYWVE